MSLEFKQRFKENLDLIPVYIEDTSLTSEAYFGIKEFPSFFGRGKNGVRVKPNRVTLKPNSQLYIEILDVNRRSVYYEIPDYEPGDLSRYISVWVYGERDDMYNTPNGIGEMIICGIAERTDDGEIIPEEFRDVINVRWRRKISISRDSRSESPIVFSQTLQPTLSVSQSITFFKNIPTSSISGSTAKTNETLNIPIVYTSDFGGQNVFLELQSSSAFFKPEYLNSGVIKFNLQNVTLSPAITSAERDAGILKPIRYSASLQSLVTNKKVRVNPPLTASITTKFQSILKTFTGFSTGSFSIEYLSTGSAGTIPLSIVNIKINNINPIIGNVDKINVYARSRSILSENTQYRLIGVKILNEPISSSITDIYYNTTGNLTSSIFTFPFTPLKENDSTDIKVEFVNILNDTSEFILEKELYIPGPPPPPPPPISMGTPTITITPQFNPDRFNNEPQTYLVTGSFPTNILGSYEYIVSASIFTGSVLLATTSIPSTRSISISQTTSGPQTYTLQLTASRDLSFSSEYIQTESASFYTGTINKSEPDVPIITYGPALDIQNGLGFTLGSNPSLFSIEQHATGSILFRYNTGSDDNRWEYIPNSLTASIVTGNTTIQYRGISNQANIIHSWTGSMTGSLPVYLSASANYKSPGTLNNPTIFRTPKSSPYTFQKIKSIRHGMWPTSSLTTPLQLFQDYPDIITNLGLWSLPLTRSISNFGTTTFNANYIFAGFNGHAIVVCDDAVSIISVKDISGNPSDMFSTTPNNTTNINNFITINGYKMYLSRAYLNPLDLGPLTVNISQFSQQ